MSVYQVILISMLISVLFRPQEPINTQIFYSFYKNVNVVFRIQFYFYDETKKFSANFDVILLNFLILLNIFHRILDRESDGKLSLNKVITDIAEICRKILDKMSVQLDCFL
jgi:hypothetical protein